jgi:Phosphotransferase enzyme family
MSASNQKASNPRHNWLPAAIPADARRFRVTDVKLAATLAQAGGKLVQDAPDVDIVDHENALGDDAPFAIVSLGIVPREGGARLLRPIRRLAHSLGLRMRAARSRRYLRRRGYPTSWVVLWEWEHTVRVPSLRPRRDLGWRERLPLNALVVGSRRGRPATVLDASLAGASQRLGTELDAEWPLATQSGLVVLAHESVLRVAVGPSGSLLQRQRDVLKSLRHSSTDPRVLSRSPSILGYGDTELGTWSLEQRLPGSPARPELSDGLLAECVDFLLALHETGDNSTPTNYPSRDAQIVARAAGQKWAALVLWLGDRIDEALREIPRVFAHGDFWSRNLLVRDGSLVGVVDWDNGGPGRLPFLDLIQLRVNMVRAGTKQFLGPAVVEYLLPWAAGGGDEVTSDYASRIGVELSSSLLESLVIAHWLDRVGHEIESHADRVERPVWMHRNIELVLQGIVDAAVLRPPVAELTSH